MALELTLILGSPYAWRVQLALEHKELPYTTRVLSMSAGELRSQEHLARSPRGKVPLLTDGDFIISESIAILAYLERRSPERPLFGVTAEETGTIWRHVSEYTAYVDEAVEAFILPVYFDRVAEEAERVRHAIATLTVELATYDRLFRTSEYLAGPTLTAADFVVFPHVQSVLRAASKPAANTLELPFLPLATKHPALAAWLERIARMPGYERAYPQNWRAALT